MVTEYITEEGLRKTSMRLFPKGTILMAMIGQGKTRGQVAILNLTATINQNAAAIMFSGNDINEKFIYHQLRSKYDEIRSISNGSGQQNLNAQLIGQIKITLPGLEKQKQIVSVLDSWDSAIEKTERLIELKERQLSWIRAQYFTGKRRLAGSTKPWRKHPLSSILAIRGDTSRGDEEVFSVSVHKGLVNQIEHLGRVFSAKDTSRYSRVESGDIVYTRSPTGDFPYGIIKQSKVEATVIVSPLYGVFRPGTVGIGAFLDFYFESAVYACNYLHPLIQKGAKNTINITDEGFLRGYIDLPADDTELRSLVKIVGTAKEEMRTLRSIADSLVSQKSFLMSKLLTGEWEAPELGAKGK